VCQDEKAAVLLDVVESFKEKYIAAAKGVSPALLISALNILSDAEINYKAARNKRLHVELALIKLCYLQQAIRISAEGNDLSKKKVVEAARSMAFRQIRPFAVKESAVGSRQSAVGSSQEAGGSLQDTAKLVIETPSTKKIIEAVSPPFKESAIIPTEAKQKSETTKLSALDKIRQQYLANGIAGTETVNHPLQEVELHTAWAEYIIQLKAAKNPAAQPFQRALLRIKDENSFEAVTGNNIEKQFIEQDRNKLFAFLQERLKNKLLHFNVIAEEKTDDRPPEDIPLSAKEQFLKMAGQYPMVKELKDRLRLELDY